LVVGKEVWPIVESASLSSLKTAEILIIIDD